MRRASASSCSRREFANSASRDPTGSERTESASLIRLEMDRRSRAQEESAFVSRSAAPYVRGLIYGSLIVAAVVYAGSMIMLGLDPDDVGRLETPFALSVAMQLERGPAVLYGPFDDGNHLVMIHAPLYYRLAALLGALADRLRRPADHRGAGRREVDLALGGCAGDGGCRLDGETRRPRTGRGRFDRPLDRGCADSGHLVGDGAARFAGRRVSDAGSPVGARGRPS